MLCMKKVENHWSRGWSVSENVSRALEKNVYSAAGRVSVLLMRFWSKWLIQLTGLPFSSVLFPSYCIYYWKCEIKSLAIIVELSTFPSFLLAFASSIFVVTS